MSAEVRAIVLRNPPFYPSFVTDWISRDQSQAILWSPTSTADIFFHSGTLQKPPTKFKEVNDQAEWGTMYFATPAVSR